MSLITMPEDCKHYITDVLKKSLDDVIADRLASNDEPRYAVLMKDGDKMSTIVFVHMNAVVKSDINLSGWSCLSDSDEWPYSIHRFKTAPAKWL